MDLITGVGLAAAVLTTASIWPQLKKCQETKSAGDLSLKKLIALFEGQARWITYGVLKGDWVTIWR